MPIYRFKTMIPAIDPSVFIAPSATVIGQVSIGPSSSVWFNSVVRGDEEAITIGSATNIQDLSMLHADPSMAIRIGNRVTIGHQCVIHGCTVEDDCLIGMGSILLNGAVIGKGSVVAAGTVILEKTVIPPYSLVVGVPGRIKKQFESNIVEITRLSAAIYAEKAGLYGSPEWFEPCSVNEPPKFGN